MSVPIDKLVQSILKKNSLQQCSIGELQQLADQYPYFDAIQVLLAKKLSVDGEGTHHTAAYEQQLQKTLLFFQHPLWLQHLLNDGGNGASVEVASVEVASVEVASVEVATVEAANVEAASVEVANVESVGAMDNCQRFVDGPAEDEPKVSETQLVEPVMISTDPVIQPTAATEEQPEPATADPEPATAEAENESEPAFDLPRFKIEPIDPAEAELSFEPYHTVDYFASQGIKFNSEEGPKDKFGKQLKSFTEWLKAMKRVPVAQLTELAGEAAGEKVEKLAEHSLADREVITEAMAEVWKKQGNKARAIEIYHKLSLLDPSKSRYFAAQIDLLK